MPIDLGTLLAPVCGNDPAGPDLAYDPQRHEIEQAFEASVSIDTTGSATAASETDWRRVVSTIVAQSARTKDLWLAVYLCRAGARAGQLETIDVGARYLAGLIDRYWPDVHPRLDDYGVEGRIGACDTLTSHREFLSPLRGMKLLSHPRHGVVTGDDLLRLMRGGDAESDYGAFRAMLSDPQGVTELAAAAATIGEIEASLRSIEEALGRRAGVGAGTSFAAIYEVLSELRSAARAFLPTSDSDAVGEADVPKVDAGAAGPELAASNSIESREEVVRAIDLVVDYYRRREPHSPVPLLMTRAREWIGRGFLEVLGDIAPTAVGEARQLLQFRAGEG